MARALGTDDSITNCDCCGKSGLKFTVIMELDDGEIAHYGQVCAGRNTGKTRPQITSEIKAHAEAQKAAARAEFFAHPSYAAERAQFAARPRNLTGKAAMEFVESACAAADAVRDVIAAKYGVTRYTLL